MWHRTWGTLASGFFLLVNLTSPMLSQSARDMEANGHLRVDLVPIWTTGIISDGVGPSNIVVTDLDQDGVTDIVACSGGSVYVLNQGAGGDYGTVWYSEQLGCGKVAVGDRDDDGIQEIYVGTSSWSRGYELFQQMQPRHLTANLFYEDYVWEQLANSLNSAASSKVYIFRGDNFQKVGMLSLPDSTGVADIGVADIDNDGSKEIVIVRSDATLVYDANTLTLEWQAAGKGGNKLGIGDIDGDSQPEIVVNGNPAHILNAILKIEEWAYSGGFGIDMGVADVDGDNIAEIAYITGSGYSNSDIYVFEADTLTTKWHVGPIFGLNVVAVGDTDGNGSSEVLTGSGQWGSVTGYRGSDGTQLWSIPNPEHGVFGIGVGDADNDGTNEVVWGAGLTSTGKDALCIGDWESESVEWTSDDLDGPLYVAAGDIDNDGQVEIVMASRSTTSGYDGGTIRVYNGTNHQLEWSTLVSSSYYDLYQVAIGQLDADAALEIVVGGDNWYDTRLQVYDGISQTMEWQSAVLASGAPRALLVHNLDADPTDEIVVGLSNQHVQIFNGATSVIQWDSGGLDGAIKDVSVGDLDGDSVLELAILTSQSVYVFEVGTWTQKLHKALGNGTQLVIANANLSGAGELLIVTSGSGSTLQAWTGTSYEQIWQRYLGDVTVNDITTADLDGDGDEEFIMVGPNLLLIGSQIILSSYWPEYQSDGSWGSINGAVFADIDNDGQGELAFGSSSLIQINEIISSPLTISMTYLPVVARSQ